MEEGEKDAIQRPKASRGLYPQKSPRDRLFNISKATRPILDYIKAIEIGYRPGEREEEEREWRRLDTWDLDRLEEEE